MEPTNCSHPMPSPAPSSILRLCKRLLLRAIQGFTVLSKSILRSISAGTVVILNTRFPFVRLDAQINNTHRRTNKQYTNHSEWGSEPLDQPQTSRANPVKWHSTHNKSHPCPPRIDQATRKQDDKWVYATHCNTLQHTATHCNTLHHVLREQMSAKPTINWCWIAPGMRWDLWWERSTIATFRKRYTIPTTSTTVYYSSANDFKTGKKTWRQSLGVRV